MWVCAESSMLHGKYRHWQTAVGLGKKWPHNRLVPWAGVTVWGQHWDQTLHTQCMSQIRVHHSSSHMVSLLVSWCFESSRPQRITSGMNKNFILSPSYSFHKSWYHKSCLLFFLAYLYSTGSQHRNLHPARWPILFCRPTQKWKNQERFQKKCRWMDRKGRNKQGKNPWQ